MSEKKRKVSCVYVGIEIRELFNQHTRRYFLHTIIHKITSTCQNVISDLGQCIFYQPSNVISHYGPSFSRLLFHDETLVTCSPPLQLSFYSSTDYNTSTYSIQFTKYNCISSLISQKYLHLAHTFRSRHTANGLTQHLTSKEIYLPEQILSIFHGSLLPKSDQYEPHNPQQLVILVEERKYIHQSILQNLIQALKVQQPSTY